MKKPAFKMLAVAALTMCTVGANAAVGDVTTNFINDSTVTNGSFTIGNTNGVEVGLRARVRFDSNNLPTNDSAQNGTGNTYSVPVGNPAPGYSWQVNSPSTAKWNFDWSVNTDPTATSTGKKVGDYTYLLSLDFDPGVGTNFLTFNPINGATTLADHSFGNNATPMGGGAEAANASEYTGLLAACRT